MDPDALITEVAKRHGVALSQDDPVMILATLNELLFEENAKAQALVLRKFKSDMESVSKSWTKEAQVQLNNMLAQALESHRQVLSQWVEEHRQSINEEIHASRVETQDSRMRGLLALNLMFSVATAFLVALSWLI